MVRLDAPDQIVHGLEGCAPFAGVVALLQAGQQQHLAPGLAQDTLYCGRQRVFLQTLTQDVLDLQAGDLGARPAFLGIAGALLEQFAAPLFVADIGHEVGQQLGEDLWIVDEVGQQALHDLLDLLIQAVALQIALLAPAQGGGGDLVEQPPGRMAATAEKGLVEDRDLEHGNLQASDQRLERIRQGKVVENEFEQHRHQVDDVFVDLPHHALSTRALADAAQGHPQLRLEVIALQGLAGNLLLQVRQQPHEVVAGDGLAITGRGTLIDRHAATQGGAARRAQLGQEALQGTKELLTVVFAVDVGRGAPAVALGRAARHLLGDGLELGQYAGVDQLPIGFRVQLTQTIEHETLEQLVDDQLDLDVGVEIATGFDEGLAQPARAQRMGRVVQLARQLGIESDGQVADGHGVVAERLGHHGVHGDALFQRIVLHQAEVFIGDAVQAHLRLAADQVVQRGEALEILLEKAALDTLAAQT